MSSTKRSRRSAAASKSSRSMGKASRSVSFFRSKKNLKTTFLSRSNASSSLSDLEAGSGQEFGRWPQALVHDLREIGRFFDHTERLFIAADIFLERPQDALG